MRTHLLWVVVAVVVAAPAARAVPTWENSWAGVPGLFTVSAQEITGLDGWDDPGRYYYQWDVDVNFGFALNHTPTNPTDFLGIRGFVVFAPEEALADSGAPRAENLGAFLLDGSGEETEFERWRYQTYEESELGLFRTLAGWQDDGAYMLEPGESARFRAYFATNFPLWDEDLNYYVGFHVIESGPGYDDDGDLIREDTYWMRYSGEGGPPSEPTPELPTAWLLVCALSLAGGARALRRRT